VSHMTFQLFSTLLAIFIPLILLVVIIAGAMFVIIRSNRERDANLNKITVEEALRALDDMDDYARMTTGVDAYGPRECLRRFIMQSQSQSPKPVRVPSASPGVA